MTTRKVSLEVIAADGNDGTCAPDCPFLRPSIELCVLFDIHLSHDPEHGWERLAACTKAEDLAAADDAVLEAAERYQDEQRARFHSMLDGDTAERVRRGNLSPAGAVLDAVTDARRKLRATRGTEG